MRSLLPFLLLSSVGCGGSVAATSTCSPTESLAEAPAAPFLQGTYVIDRMVSGEGQAMVPSEVLLLDDTVGVRFSLVFDGANVGIELLTVSEDQASLAASESHRSFVVSACSASQGAIWAEDGFLLPSDLAGAGVANTVIVDRIATEDGVTDTNTHAENHNCSVSLNAGSFRVVESGPLSADGRPSTLVLAYGSDGLSRMELTATLPIADLNFREFARETAAREDREAAAEPSREE